MKVKNVNYESIILDLKSEISMMTDNRRKEWLRMLIKNGYAPRFGNFMLFSKVSKFIYMGKEFGFEMSIHIDDLDFISPDELLLSEVEKSIEKNQIDIFKLQIEDGRRFKNGDINYDYWTK